MQLPFRAVSVNPPISDCRRGAWTFVEAKVVAVGRRIIEQPNLVAAFRFKTLDGFAVSESMEQNEFTGCRPGSAESLATRGRFCPERRDI